LFFNKPRKCEYFSAVAHFLEGGYQGNEESIFSEEMKGAESSEQFWHGGKARTSASTKDFFPATNKGRQITAGIIRLRIATKVVR
jgi:hypothetical protein